MQFIDAPHKLCISILGKNYQRSCAIIYDIMFNFRPPIGLRPLEFGLRPIHIDEVISLRECLREINSTLGFF